MLTVESKPIVGLAPATQRQNAETALYVLSLVVVGLAVLGGPRVAAAVARGAGGSALGALTAALVAALATSILGARAIDRIAEGGGTEILLALLIVWSVVAALTLRRAAGERPWPALAPLVARERLLWLAAAVLAGLLPVVVVDPESLSILPLLLGAVVVVAVCLRREVPALGGRAGLAVDLAALLLLLLLIPDLVVIRPEEADRTFMERYEASVMQFHQDFLLGPANQVLHGDGLLRDTAAQYGVGSVFFLVGWFALVDISYGTFALMDSIITAAHFAMAYVVLRVAGASRAVAGTALAVGVVVLVYNRGYPVGLLPQEGPLRFGLPMGVLLAAVAGARWPEHARLARAVGLLFVGISAIWALEGFALTLGVYGALACLTAAQQPRGGRLRALGRDALAAVVAILAAHALLLLVVLLGRGYVLDWGQYLAFLEQFLFGHLGNLTYDFSRWSAGLAVGAAYLVSALAIVLLLRLRPAFAAGRPATVTAIAGVTAYGICQLYYLVDRSGDHVVAYVGLPALMAAALWLALVLDPRTPVGSRARTAAVAMVGATAVLVVSAAWSSVGEDLPRTPLAHLVPGGDSVREAVARLRAFPRINGRAPEGEALLERHMPGERRSVVLTSPDLIVEILMRADRGNALPLSYPREDDFTPDVRWPGVREAVDELRPGRRILVDEPTMAALEEVGDDRDAPLLTIGGGATSALQLRALWEIDQRFRLERVARGEQGLLVLELRPRRG